MKKIKFKFPAVCAAACAALIAAAIPCAAVSASACSGVPYDEGVNSYDVVPVGGKSELSLQKEKITFDVSDFPTSGDEKNYKSAVTAEYTFYNPADEAVKQTLAIPAGELPYYFNSYEGFAPQVYTDGVKAETKVRHTFGSYHYFTDGVALSDDYVSGDFLTPELNVAVYEVKVTGSVDRRYSYECVADVENVDASKTRFISSGFYDVVTYYDDYDDNDKIYVLGEDIAADLKWTVARYGYGSHKQVDNEVELTKVEDVKFSDFILSFRKEDSKVSEVDWYNGLVGSLDEDDVTIHYTAICYADDWHFTQWYAYDFEVQPKATVVNKVTTALFPRIYDDYSPYVYRYRYEFAPATYWADYGELEIVVKTNYFMTDMPSAFEQCVGGYKATYLTAPQYDLNFELCTVSNPSYERPGVSFPFGVLAVPLIIGIALVVMGGIAGIAVTIAVAVKKS